MEIYNLSKTDIEDIEIFERINGAIAKILEKMNKLEQRGGKNSTEYKRLEEYLEITMEEEQKAYEKRGVHGVKAVALSEYIDPNEETINAPMFETMFIGVFTPDKSGNVISKQCKKQRIMKILDDLSWSGPNFMNHILNVIAEQLADEFNDLDEIPAVIEIPKSEVEKRLNEGRSFNSVYEAQERELTANALSLLDIEIAGGLHPEIRKYLIRAKYALKYNQTEFEVFSLANSPIYSSINKDLQIDKEAVEDEIGVDSEELSSLGRNFALENSINQMDAILKLPDGSFNTELGLAYAKIRSILLRATGVILDDEALNDLRELNKQNDNGIARQVVHKTLREIKFDKKRLGYEPSPEMQECIDMD